MSEEENIIKKQETEIKELKKLLEQYEKQQQVSLSNMSISQVPVNEGTFTIKGLEEAVIHIDENDNIYISDSVNERIQIFKYLAANENIQEEI